jgi:hypothetical protein
MAPCISPAALEVRLAALGVSGSSWVYPASPLAMTIAGILCWAECASEIGDLIAYDLKMRGYRAELVVHPDESVAVVVDGKPLVVGRIVNALETEWTIGGAA